MIALFSGFALLLTTANAEGLLNAERQLKFSNWNKKGQNLPTLSALRQNGILPNSFPAVGGTVLPIGPLPFNPLADTVLPPPIDIDDQFDVSEVDGTEHFRAVIVRDGNLRTVMLIPPAAILPVAIGEGSVDADYTVFKIPHNDHHDHVMIPPVVDVSQLADVVLQEYKDLIGSGAPIDHAIVIPHGNHNDIIVIDENVEQLEIDDYPNAGIPTVLPEHIIPRPQPHFIPGSLPPLGPSLPPTNGPVLPPLGPVLPPLGPSLSPTNGPVLPPLGPVLPPLGPSLPHPSVGAGPPSWSSLPTYNSIYAVPTAHQLPKGYSYSKFPNAGGQLFNNSGKKGHKQNQSRQLNFLRELEILNNFPSRKGTKKHNKSLRNRI